MVLTFCLFLSLLGEYLSNPWASSSSSTSTYLKAARWIGESHVSPTSISTILTSESWLSEALPVTLPLKLPATLLTLPVAPLALPLTCPSSKGAYPSSKRGVSWSSMGGCAISESIGRGESSEVSSGTSGSGMTSGISSSSLERKG